VALTVETRRGVLDVEQILDRAQRAVVVVVAGADGARLDVWADQHVTGVTATGGRIVGVVLRIRRRRLGAERDARNRGGRGQRSAVRVDELERARVDEAGG